MLGRWILTATSRPSRRAARCTCPSDAAASGVASKSANAFEKVVDRLLASPHYGERVALPWLDAARFADSNGFQQDGDTFHWLWRDWVIHALNDDVPYDHADRLFHNVANTWKSVLEAPTDVKELLPEFYATSAETAQRLGTARLGLTIPFVLYGIFRYLYLVHQKRGGGSPTTLLVTDGPLLACVGLWSLAVAVILYTPLGR